MTRFWEVLDRWFVPPALKADWRATFLVRTWVHGLVLLGFFALGAAQQGLWVLLATQAATMLAGITSLVWLRLSQSPEATLRFSMISVLVSFPLLGLMQTPPNLMSPVFIILVPLFSSFVLSWQETKLWLVVAMLWGGSAVYLAASGVHLHTAPRPNHGLVAALNYGGVVLVVVYFARWFHRTREELMERVQHALDARTRFLANVSHEIRTPMNAVLGLTELLLTTRLEQAQRAQLELVRESGQSLVGLIDELLDLTRLDAGRLVLTPEATDLRGLIESIGQLFAPRAKEKQLTLTVQLEGVPPRVSVDPLRFRQVLSNLLSNAIKFTDSGGVTVGCRVAGEQLHVSVEDTGPGLTDDVRARLFQVFEQGDASTTRRYGGSGLGLALSRELVRLMGGDLTVESTPSRGSRFLFFLPLVVASAQPTLETGELRCPPSELPVLVVDDNPVNLLVARGLVERLGYRVETATNGREATEAVQRQRYALVLMDCHMPEMDGLEATRRLRAAGERVPIVALTASGLPEDLAACSAAGMDECLVKPVTTVALVAVLRRRLTA